MIAKFFAAVLAGLSEEMLMDLARLLVREYMLKRKKDDISKAVADLKAVVDETAKAEGMSDAEKNARLVDAGRAVADRLRDGEET